MKLALASIAIAVLCACNATQQRQAQSQAQEIASSAPAQTKDAYLSVAVGAKLAAIDVDSTTAVHVSADNGVVTLAGRVRDAGERASYESAAQSVNGVTAVRNLLSIDPHLRGPREDTQDAALEARVTTAIAGQAGINVFHVNVAAHDGKVTLTGRVPSHAIAQTIVETARTVNGVQAVKSRLNVGR